MSVLVCQGEYGHECVWLEQSGAAIHHGALAGKNTPLRLERVVYISAVRRELFFSRSGDFHDLGSAAETHCSLQKHHSCEAAMTVIRSLFK